MLKQGFNRCHDCNHNLVVKPHLYCDQCRKPPWQPQGRFPKQSCWECGELRVLDESGLCSTCYNKLYRARYAAICGECHEEYQPESKVQWVCHNCMPKCYSCGDKFTPTDRHDVLCKTCWDKRNAYEFCGRCHALVELNDYAQCSDCERHSLWVNRCRVCDSTVEGPERVCVDCSKEYDICPRCEANEKPKGEYICNRCKTIQGQECN